MRMSSNRLRSECEDINATWHAKFVDALVLRLLCMRENLKTPKLSPMADNAIIRGGIGSLGSLVYIYGTTYLYAVMMCYFLLRA